MIVEPAVLLAFIPAALALNLTPGADMMFCLGQGLRSGPRAALAADAGIALGCMVHVLTAGAGLGAVVSRAPVVFDVIRWLGVLCLLWLAYVALTSGPVRESTQGAATHAFRDGLIVNLANPKVILFVLAFLPQFVDPARPVLSQFLLLGTIISLGGLIVNGILGLSAGGIGHRLARSPKANRWLGRISATIFVALAVRLAFLQRS
jgi:threonine/homoserine/homoserine lactone efflux protein